MNNKFSPTRNKGNHLNTLPDNYTVIDIETTGLSSSKNEIIELSALRIRNNKISETFTTLVKPQGKINYFISNLTGITNQMVSIAPPIENILEKYINFIGKDIVIGHNVNFDINFIYDKYAKYFNKEFSNDYIDTCIMSRKLCKLEHHKLNCVANYYNIDSSGHHRAEQDCYMTYKIYDAMKNEIANNKSETTITYVTNKI